MAEDFIYRGHSSEAATAMAYRDLSTRLSNMGVNLEERVNQPDGNTSPESTTDLDPALNTERGAQMNSTLTVDQKHVVDEILSAVRKRRPACFFVNGQDGSGKTYLYQTLYNILTGDHHSVHCAAWTGIASNVPPYGRTISSLFKLNMKDDN